MMKFNKSPLIYFNSRFLIPQLKRFAYLSVKQFELIPYRMYSSALLNPLMKLIAHRWIEARNFENVDSYISTKSQNITYVKKFPRDLFYSNPKFDNINSGDSNLIKVPAPDSYAIILHNAWVIGSSNLVLLDDQKALYDLYFFDKLNKYRYTDEGIKYYYEDTCLIKLNHSNTSFEKGIHLSGNFSWNYYHLLFEILIKFEKIDSLNIDNDIPLLVDKVCLDVPQYSELLSLLNKMGRNIIHLSKGKRYLVHNLYYFSCPNIIPPSFVEENSVKAEDFLYDLSSLQYLRKTLLQVNRETNFPKRIYISREKASQTSQRRKFNEKQVFKVLEKHGFKAVFPEDYTIVDQIALFNNADFIAGGSGAAFTNLLFCKKSCKVICFTNYKLPFSIFSTIASFVGFELLYLGDDSKNIDNMTNHHDSFTINTVRLNTIVSEWLS
jgi:capsular polysaccharide biosynthesis protein